MLKLQDIVTVNKDFRNAINLYLSLNKREKILSYIPTKSSLRFLGEYLNATIKNKEQATLLVGPYGKGKSHLLLVLLAIISMERNDRNTRIVEEIVEKIDQKDRVGSEVSEIIFDVWNNHKRMLPVLISGSHFDLNQGFLYGLNDALKREGLAEITPETFFSTALERIQDWRESYPDTYKLFEKQLEEKGMKVKEIEAGIREFSEEAFNVFRDIYPSITAGSIFNPMVMTDVLPLYKSIAEKLCDEYEYEGIYIVFDEFSKYIESQNGTASGNNMKLIQDMCELAVDSRNAKVFITLVAHKSIKEYGKYLSQDIINSFTGIEGRIIEKLFVTSSKNNYELIKNAIIRKENIEKRKELLTIFSEKSLIKYYQMPFFKSDFSKDDFENLIFKGCFPLSPISAYLLLNISEKVAQNERTLFTFISNDEPNSLARYIEEYNETMEFQINASLIYDYFATLFKKEIINEHVHNEWLNAEYAISKSDSIEQVKVLKALALILIVNKDSELPATEGLVSLASGVSDGNCIIAELQEKGLIYKKGSTNSFLFKTRAGSELKAEIKRQRDLRGDNISYQKIFDLVTGKHYVIPRRYNTNTWMTRYFLHEYMNVDDFLRINDKSALFDDNSIDGKVITLYSLGTVKQDVVKKHVKEIASSKLIIVSPKKKFTLLKQVLDLGIIQDLKKDAFFFDNNEILSRELPLMEEDFSAEIQRELDSIYDEKNGSLVFWYDGLKLKSYDAAKEENAVNDACFKLYYKSPQINNEMINRRVLTTGQTKKTRLNIVNALLNHSDDDSFFNGTNQEATIYRALFVNTGIREGRQNEIFSEILQMMNTYIDSCADGRKSMQELISTLVSEPYGMRLVVIPIYLAYVLAHRREDIVVYFEDLEVQLTADIVVNMCEKPEDYELFVSKEDVEKEKYISSLNNLFDVEDNLNLSENRIKNIYICMQRWFRALPQVTRNVMDFSAYIEDEQIVENILLLKRMLQKIEANPYEILFVVFPESFGDGKLEQAFAIIDTCKTMLDDYYDWVVNEVITSTLPIFASRRRVDLHHAVKEWYDKQSALSKQGLHSGRITNFMACIKELNVYDDAEVAKKLVKAATDVYVDNWNDNSFDEYLKTIERLKTEIESIKKSENEGKMRLSFVNTNGDVVERFYDRASEGTGVILRNVIEDALEEFDDLSVNDRVAILLEMIEKTIS